jgi:hypothetical protein
MHLLEAALASQISKRPELAPLAARKAGSGPFLRLGSALAVVALLVLILDGAATARTAQHPEGDLAGRIR